MKSVVVKTKLGRVEGQHLPTSNVTRFLGIPYAEPPVGALRFKKPVPKSAWKETFKATSKPNTAPQLRMEGYKALEKFNPNTELSEDCLYLNIWSPARDEGEKLPVMIWIHGGAFLSSSSALDLFDGEALASRQNVVVASMQYRLGSLGFMYLGSSDCCGNQGLWDQLLAMKWIQDNIAAFGGDRDNITLFGESAGAASIGLHLISPHSRNLFHKAILQSGSPLCDWAVLPAEEATRRSKKLAKELLKTDEPDISTLRELPFDKFPQSDLKALEIDPYGCMQFSFVPVVDGDFLPKHPSEMLASGEFSRIPVLAGFNKNEGSIAMVLNMKCLGIIGYPCQNSINEGIFQELLDEFFAYFPQQPKRAPAILLDGVKLLYSPFHQTQQPSTSDYLSAIEKATGDWAFFCPMLNWLNGSLKASNPPKIFLYEYTHRLAAHPWPKWVGVMHADELPMVFGNPGFAEHSSEEQQFSDVIMTYWTNFAKTGDPNCENSPEIPTWPGYTLNDQLAQQLSVDTLVNSKKPSAVTVNKALQCEFWKDFANKLCALSKEQADSA